MIREVLRAVSVMYLVQPNRVDILAIVHGRQQVIWPTS